MPTELKIPEVGESITEVQISEWLKAEGDMVKQDEAVAVIDSEKTTFDLPAPQAGRLIKILHKAGDTVKVGEAVAHLESAGGDGESEPAEKEALRKSKPEVKQTDESKAKSKKPQPDGKPDREEKPTTQDESSRRREEADSDAKSAESVRLVTSAATADTPKPTSEPVVNSKPSANREEEIVPMTMLRRTVARRLVEARQTMAMLTSFTEVDMSAVQALRKEHQEAFEKRYQVRLGLMSFFVKAAIDALKQFPQLNAEIRGNDIVYHNYFDMGVAIATDRGLVVPVLRNADRLSFAELEKAIGDFAARAKEGKLKPAELEGGTFTITNGGVFGSLLSTPIINPPQTGILGMHTIQERPVVVEGQIAIRPMMYLALTYDHRLVDGREAVLFLRRLKEDLESVARMLIEV